MPSDRAEDSSLCECAHAGYDHSGNGPCSRCACEYFDRRVDAVVVNHRTCEVTELAWNAPSYAGVVTRPQKSDRADEIARAWGSESVENQERLAQAIRDYAAEEIKAVKEDCRISHTVETQRLNAVTAERDEWKRRAEEVEERRRETVAACAEERQRAERALDLLHAYESEGRMNAATVMALLREAGRIK